MRKQFMWAAAALMAASPVLAATDLSRPGAIQRLQSEKPEHHEAVMEVARVAQLMNCSQQDAAALKRIGVESFDCGFVNNSMDPPRRKVSFEIGGEAYVLTVRLVDVPPKLSGRDR
jgi:hypothetical protein